MDLRRLFLPTALFFLLFLSFLFVPFSHAAVPAPFSQQPFTDVPSGSPEFKAVEYLRTNNVLKGYQDGTFHPNRFIKRADFLQVITNEFFLHGRQDNCVLVSTASGSTFVFFP